jgi:large-conductance mechanosensitive channel
MNAQNANTQVANFSKGFSKFFFKTDLLNLILAVYLGAVLQDFFTSIVNGAIMPMLMALVPRSKYDNFSDIKISIHGIDISAGNIITNTIKLFIGFLLSYIIIRYVVLKYVA